LRVRAIALGDRLNTSGLASEPLLSTAPTAFSAGRAGMVVLFRYGAAVLIGLTPPEEVKVLEQIADRVIGAEASPEEESAQIYDGPDQQALMTDSGGLQMKAASLEHRLIMADAMAKSVALARDERQMAAVFEDIEPFAESLATGGRWPGGRRAIIRLIGRALLAQQRLAGRVAVRDKPDLLWDRPDLERFYARLEDEYELVERAEAIDRKLSVIGATATALLDISDTSRSLRLEILVVLLILAEVAIALLGAPIGRVIRAG
jgi:uncharacterized Rmd1/YagE family protein